MTNSAKWERLSKQIKLLSAVAASFILKLNLQKGGGNGLDKESTSWYENTLNHLVFYKLDLVTQALWTETL